MSIKLTKRNVFALSAIATSLLLSACDSDSDDSAPTGPAAAKNVILMISDGASDGAWDISSYWTHGEALNDVEPYVALDTRLAMTTFPLNSIGAPLDCGEEAAAEVSYDASKVWDETAINEVDGAYTRPFAGYSYINRDATDSAAAGTALATGNKTYNGAVSVDYCGRPLTTITQVAKAGGRATGIVTSVEFDHATPAVFGAHNISRGNYATIGHDMLVGGMADLIMGAGHPLYDGDGQLRADDERNFKYISEQDWSSVNADGLYPVGADLPWQLMDDKADFEALAAGTAEDALMNGPLFGLVPVGYTLQQGRSCADDEDATVAFDCAMSTSVPSLAVMTTGALNYLGQNENGLFLMVEGGAVDWAAHGNQTARIIEEQVDFNDSVQAVVDWVEENSSWDETLLIVTTDHGNSYVLGGTSDQVAYAAVENPGQGVMPEVKYYSGSHTQELVRVYAKGLGADLLNEHVVANDENYVDKYNHSGANGDYIDNVNIFDVMNTVMTR